MMGGCRLSPAVVEARRALLEQCLLDIVHGGAPELRSAPPLLAFLSPAGQSPSSEAAPRRSSFGAASARSSVCSWCAEHREAGG